MNRRNVMEQRIKNIVFDIGGVLADFRIREFLSEKGFDGAMIRRILKASVMSPYWGRFERGELTEEEALQRVEIETTSGGWLSCMAFTGLNLSPSDPLTLAYDGRHRLTIRAGTGDAQGFRTAVSSDDLLLVPGQANTVRIVADRKCLVSLMAPGIYR